MTFSNGLLIGLGSASLLALVSDYFIFKAYAKFASKKVVEAYNKGVEDMRVAYKEEFAKRAAAIMQNVVKDSSVTYDKPVVVATNGLCGDRMMLDIDGITFAGALNEVGMRLNFEGKNIGLAKLSKAENTIQAKLEIDVTVHNKAGQDLYPAIGGKVIESHEEDGILVIDRFEINEVSLCSSPNADPAIRSLREQFNAQAAG